MRPSATEPPSPRKTEVVTLYFCGTGITREWWGEKSRFGSPELVSTLFHEQRTEPFGKHEKYIIDGVGAGIPLLPARLFSKGFPSSPFNPRGWRRCLKEARSLLEKVLKESSGDLTLNLVGFSRGAILCMWMARDLAAEKRISAINIICLDPVPGDRQVPEDIYRLGSKVKNYVGIYAEDERSHYFDPVIPEVGSSTTRQWMFTVPGGHETMVGNNQKDAHRLDIYSSGEGFNNDPADELAKISRVTKVIVVELLGSPEWGSVGFEWNRQPDNDAFIENYDAMYRYEGFGYIRKVSFLPQPGSLVSFWRDSKREGGCRSYRRGESGHKQDRCAYKLISGKGLTRVGLEEEIFRQSGPAALRRLMKFKGALSEESLP